MLTPTPTGDSTALNTESFQDVEVDFDAIFSPHEPAPKADEKKEEEPSSTETPEESEAEQEETPAAQEPAKEESTEEIETPEAESSEEAPSNEESTEELSLIAEVAQLMGHEIAEDKEYAESTEGLATFIEDAATQLATEQLQAHLGAIPDVMAYYNHRRSGGKPEEFMSVNHPQVDYETLEIKDGDTATMKMVIQEDYKSRNVGDEIIEQVISSAEAAGTLKHMSEASKASLANMQKDAKEKQAKRQEDYAKEEAAAAEQLEKDVTDAVSAGSILGVQIPKKQQQDLIDYVLEPVDGTNTQRDLDANAMTIEDELLVAYLLKNKFSLDKLIQREASSQNAKSLRERLKESKTKTPKSSKDAKPKVPKNNKDVDVDDLDI